MSRSLRYASPPDSVASERPGAVAWSARVGRGWFAHRLELDRPPIDLAQLVAALVRWDAEGHPPEVDRRALAWETPLEAPNVSVPPRFAPSHQLGMALEGGRDGGAVDPRVRPASDDEVDAVADAHAAQHPALGEGFRQELRWLYRGLRARGATIWSAWSGVGRPIAAVTTVPGPGEVRLRELWTAADRRREGLGSALVAAAVHASPAGGRVLVCDEGGDAHRIYLNAGFRPVSRFVTVSTDRAVRARDGRRRPPDRPG